VVTKTGDKIASLVSSFHVPAFSERMSVELRSVSCRIIISATLFPSFSLSASRLLSPVSQELGP